MNIQYLSWTEYSDLVKATNCFCCIIPVGAVEAYGPHLPLGTDGLVVARVAELLAERIGAIVAPLVPVGYSISFREYPGTLTVSPETLGQYLKEMAESVIRHGCKRIIFLNGHAGNVAVINCIMDELSEREGVKCVQVDWWRFVTPFVKQIMDDGEAAFKHAGETMTSVMLYLFPDTVHLAKIEEPFPRPSSLPDGVFVPKRLNPAVDLAATGDPRLATADKGRLIVEKGLNALEEFVTSLWGQR